MQQIGFSIAHKAVLNISLTLILEHNKISTHFLKNNLLLNCNKIFFNIYIHKFTFLDCKKAAIGYVAFIDAEYT